MYLSVIVLSHNNRTELQRLLPSLRFAQKVMVIDDFSTDGSAQTAQRLGAEVWKRKLGGDFAAQRNFGLRKVKQGWVLFVDADEEVTDALAREIQVTLGKKPRVDGYYIPRRDIYLGRRLRFGETGQTKLVRLGKVKSGIWRRPVHEVWEINKVGRLQTPLLHRAHVSTRDFVEKIRRYTDLESAYRDKQGEALVLSRLITYPVGKFVQTYLWQQGFRDGWPGLVMSGLMSWHSFLVRWKLLGRQVKMPTRIHPAGRLTIMMIWLWLMLLPWGQINRVQVNSTVSIYLFEVVMGIGVIFWVIAWWQTKRQLHRPLWLGSGGIFAGILLLSLVVRIPSLGETAWLAGLYWWRVVLYGLFGWLLVDVTQAGWWRYAWLEVVKRVGIAWALLGWGQYIFMPDMRWIYFYGFDQHYYRMVGTLLDPSFLGLLMVLTFGLVYREKSPSRNVWLVLLLGGILLTYARSVYVVMGLLLLGLGWLHKNYKQMWFWLGIMLLGLWFLPHPGGEGVNLQRVYSIQSRAESGLSAMSLFWEHPILGVGFNAYKYVAGFETNRLGMPVLASGPDNSLLLILATSGLVGLWGFIWFGLGVWRSVSDKPEVRLCLFVLFVHSLTNNSLFYPFVMVWLLLVLAGGNPKRKEEAYMASTD